MHLEATSLGVCSEGCSGSQTLDPSCCWISPGLLFIPNTVHNLYRQDSCTDRKHGTSAELMKKTEDMLEKFNLVMVGFTVCDG